MASVSINTKGSRVYAKFNDGKLPAVHLGRDRKTCIMMLNSTFRNREYIEQGKYSAEDLEKFLQRINDNFKD